jgi:large subunit ribosomal protein L3
MAMILGRKIGMTQTFGPEGEFIPVTVIKAGPCKLLELRTPEKHGYSAAVVGFEEVEGARVKDKARLGFFKKLGTSVYRVSKEFRDGAGEVGADLSVGQFNARDVVEICGTSKGHGWTGVIKKWNFATGRESHGGNCQRKMGSSGMHTWPAHVIKGKKMSGRWGSEKITLEYVEVVGIVPEDNLLLVKGPLPGGKHGLLSIRKVGVAKAPPAKKAEGDAKAASAAGKKKAA